MWLDWSLGQVGSFVQNTEQLLEEFYFGSKQAAPSFQKRGGADSIFITWTEAANTFRRLEWLTNGHRQSQSDSSPRWTQISVWKSVLCIWMLG